MLPPSKVRDYVGPLILQSLEALPVDEWSEPIESGGGFYVVRVIEREPRIVPAFEQVEELVRQDLKRRRGDQALRDYLDDLRTRTPVAINESVFSASQ
jgi:parvulin-like peptidyl-prolyl isomerase